nr:hypothetical protein [Tanacetum cinerariifolium]
MEVILHLEEEHMVVEFLVKQLRMKPMRSLRTLSYMMFMWTSTLDSKSIAGLQVGDEAVYKKWGDRMERVATTASSLEAELDSGSGPRCQDTILGDVEDQTRHSEKEIASSSTSKNGEIVTTATIDGRVKYVTEASIKRHLKLEDSKGISSLPNTKFFEQLALMGFIQIFLNKHKRLLKPHKSTYVAPTFTQKLFSNMRRASKGYFGVDVPLFPTMLVQGPLLQSDRTISPPTISSPSRVPTSLHDSPLPGGNTPGSEEGRMTINELTVLCTSLSKKVESLESDLKQIKLTYRVGYTKFIMKMGAQTHGRNEHEMDSDFDFTTAEDISTANVPVTTASAEITTASPEDKTIETFDDSDDITLAETLIEIRRSAKKPQKVKGVAFRDVEKTCRLVRSTTTLQPLPSIDLKDKGKGVLVEEEHMKIDDFKPMDDDSQQQVKSSKKRQREVFDEEIPKKKKLEKDNDAEKEDLRAILDIVPRDDIAIDIESLAIKYLIIDDFKPMDDDSQQQVKSSKKRQREVFDEEIPKKKKLEKDNDAEKEDLRAILDIVPRDDIAIDIESLAIKYLIVD